MNNALETNNNDIIIMNDKIKRVILQYTTHINKAQHGANSKYPYKLMYNEIQLLKLMISDTCLNC